MSALMLTVREVHLWNPSTRLIAYPIACSVHHFALLEALFLRRALRDLHLSKANPETLSPQFVPRRFAAPRGRFAPKNRCDRVLHLRCGQEVQVRFGR